VCDFTGSTTSNDSHDVAVVTFDKPIKGIAPAALPTAGVLDDMSSAGTLAAQTFTDVGYGWHAVVSNSRNATGLFDGVRRYATSGSRSLTTSDVKLTENASLGYGGACSHDSGGPAFLGTSGPWWASCPACRARAPARTTTTGSTPTRHGRSSRTT
jgi:hypothetical protein